ncbi:MAG: DEAD/DEAH box helicase family protein [Chloroflexi bacterium]|nr:DEAD/DEAH box helicase family protein [Chloroflexota bacterium]
MNQTKEQKSEMLQEQIKRRRKRGKEEMAKIVNQGRHSVYSTFEVTSTSERIYTVQVRSLTEQLNSCTCPDYRTNTIGTCKHIEGVLVNLQKEFADQWDEFVAQAPPVTQVYVHHAEQTTIRVMLPFPKSKKLNALVTRYFDAQGILQGKITQSLPALLSELNRLSARDRKQILVNQTVHDHLKNQQDIDAVAQQKQWFLDQVEQGNRSLGVLSTPLYGYQEEGLLHLTFGRRALLADDMGLGKTIQAIAAAALLKQLRDIQHILVVTPASLKHQWAREIQRFTSLSVQVIEGNPIQRRALYRDPQFFNIINYELVRFDEEQIAQCEFDLVILDEAQRIKNWRTKTADKVKRLRSPYAFVLTGTPLENRLDELYSIFQFIDPTILGPLWRFNQRYYETERRPTGSYKVLGYQNLDELRQRIAPYVLRRVREEVLLDLPERIDSNFFVEMTDPQWKAYHEYEQRVAQLMVRAKRRPLTPDEHNILLGSLVKMRLICNALALHDPEIKPQDHEKTAPKLRELREILGEEVASNGHKAILFSQWTRMLDLTEPMLEKLDLGWVKLSGSVPTKKRGALIEQFFEDPKCKVFLSTDAGGVGLNLQAASMVVNLDLPWNPAVLAQRIARAHRHGQPRPVNVINLIAKGTIEERMLDTLAAKRAIFDAAFNEDSTVSDLSFKKAGSGVLQRLEVLLGTRDAAKPELVLTPTAAPTEAEPEAVPVPTLQGLADLLVSRYPGRILLVRESPQLPTAPVDGNILIVVDREPGKLRPKVEALINEHYGDLPTPGLLLMEQEGYRALSALTGGLIDQTAEAATVYHAPAIPAPARDDTRKALEKKLRRANKGFDTADKRLKLASVVLQGGFPEEVMRPVRQALAWALNTHLSLVLAKKRALDDNLPSPRLVEAELVASRRVTTDLAAQTDRVRTLTAPPAEDEEEAPPPSIEAAEGFIATIQELIDLGREWIAKEGM